MTKVIQKEDKELHQCEECGFQYAEKEWAEKCEAWCKEHKSCNLEITAHAIPQEAEPEPADVKVLTKLFYGLIGIASSLAFFLVLYWVLRLDSAITNLITNTYGTPLYFWPYVILTLGAIILFGVNVSLLVYRWRKFGPPKLKTETGGGAGTLFGIAASACPVCGSTLLSAIGIAGGLAAFPLGGLELKALSFGFLALPIWLIRKDLRKLEADCESGVCPMPKDHSFKEADRPWFLALLALVITLSLIGWNWLKTEPIIAKALTRENANYYVNLVWPLGLANYMSSNKESPINGKALFNFASTGGWNLGEEENGGVYFNKFKVVELTPEQEALVTKIAQNTYRPGMTLTLKQC